MENFNIVNLTTFIGAQDFDLSSQFYKNLGFTPAITTDDKILFSLGNFGFWLKNYFVKEWLDNTMLCLYVEDIQAWFSLIKGLELESNYGVQARFPN